MHSHPHSHFEKKNSSRDLYVYIYIYIAKLIYIRIKPETMSSFSSARKSRLLPPSQRRHVAAPTTGKVSKLYSGLRISRISIPYYTTYYLTQASSRASFSFFPRCSYRRRASLLSLFPPPTSPIPPQAEIF